MSRTMSGGRHTGLLSRLWRQVRGVRASDRSTGPGGEPSAVGLAELVREDLRRRYARGETPAVGEYLDRYPILRADRQRVLSLVYEEFCLREERGEALDPDSFCARYASWQDSLRSQLRYHRELSLAVSSPVSPPPPALFPEPGGRFLRYELDSELGRGGSGRVFLARDGSLGGRRVALKLTLDRSDEASLLGRLDHPQIMPISLVEDDPTTKLRAMCMPYLPGRTLVEVIQRVHALGRPRRADVLCQALAGVEPGADASGPSWPDFPRRGRFADGAAWLAGKLAQALAYSHQQGVSHRDIKPANILLTLRSGPMLLDFNLAHAPCGGASASRAATGGTLPYMAPEHLGAFLDPELWPQVGPAADLYSLGLVLRELLTGRRPDVPDSALPTPRMIAELRGAREAAPPPSIHRENPEVPHALAAIITRCLAPRPQDRYPDAAALADDLKRYLDRRPLLFTVNPCLWERTRNWFWRWRLPLVLLLGLGLAGTAYRLIRPSAEARAVQYQDLASIRVSMRLFAEGRELYNQALELRPGWYKALHGMGVAWSNECLAGVGEATALLGDPTRRDEAQRELDRIGPSLAEASRNLDLAQSAAVKDQAPARDLAAILKDRARLRITRGQDAQARGAIAYFASNGQLDEAARREFLSAGEHFQAALGELARAEALVGPSATARFDLCWALAHQGSADAASAVEDEDRARHHYSEALRYIKAALDRHPVQEVKDQAERIRRDIDIRLGTTNATRANPSGPPAP